LLFVFETNVEKGLISVEDLCNRRTKVGTTKDRFWGGTTHKRYILSRFWDKRPNRLHLVRGPKNSDGL